MKKFFLLLAWLLFVVGAACGQSTGDAYNTTILAGRSLAPAVVDGTGEEARFQSITSMWGDGVNLYVADAMTIRRVELATARVTTLSRTAATGIHASGYNTGFSYDFAGLYGLWSDGASLYGSDIGAGIIRKIDLITGGVQNVASGLGFAWGLSGSGTTLYAALARSATVMQVNAVTGGKSQFASTGFGTPSDCHLGSGCIGYFVPGPRSMWGDAQNLYITGYSGTVKKLDIASGQQTFLPDVPFNIGPITGAGGRLFVGAVSGPQLGSVRLDTGEFAPIALPADGLSITALWSDAISLYVAQGFVIRRVDLATGNVSEFAGLLPVAEFANGIGPQARFSNPLGIWADGGSLYVADALNFSIRRIDSATGAVTQVAGSPNMSAIQDGIGTSATFTRPFGVWGDGKSLYVTDAQSIRRVALDTTEVRTIAGGTISGARDGAGRQAQFRDPQGLWGRGGILYIADTGNAVIRQLNTASNEVTTLAGSFGAFGTTDGPADSARFTFPTVLWSDNATLYVADYAWIRAISLDTGIVRTLTTLPSLRPQGSIIGLWGDGSSLYTLVITRLASPRFSLYRIATDTGDISQVLHGSADADAGLPIFFPGAGAISGDASHLFITDDRDNTVRLLTRDAPPTRMRIQITNPGFLSRTTTGTPDAVSTGYARLSLEAGSVTPAGFAIFALRQNGVLVSEASVPAAHAIRSGRIIATAGGAVSTGIAIMNPGSAAAVISFYFTDATGQNSNQGSFTLDAGAQIARFLTEAPFNGSAPMDGTFTFVSPVPVSAVALRGYINERSEFLMTTLPVVDLANLSSAPTIVTHFATGTTNFANGDGWGTSLTLINPSDQPISGTLEIIDAGPLFLTSSSYSIAARAVQQILIAPSAHTVTTGAVRVIPQNGATPSVVCIFSLRQNRIRVTEASVPDVPVATAFHLYAENTGIVSSGFAITNPSTTPVDLSLDFTDEQGVAFYSTTLHVDATSHRALFISQLPFTGSGRPGSVNFVRISSPGPAISVVGLLARYNERGDFLITTTPAIPEDKMANTEPLYIPHIVDGGGYTTQLVLFPASGQSSGTTLAGTVEYFHQSGTPMVLPTR